MNEKNPIIILQNVIFEHIDNDRNLFLLKFCEGLVTALQASGAAIAFKKDDRYPVAARSNLFPGLSRPVFAIAGDNSVTLIGSGDTVSDKGLLYITDPGRELILIIRQARKNIDMAAAKSAADLLARVTALRDRQHALMNRYRIYMTMFRKSSNLAAILGPDGRVLEWNEAAEELYGRSLSDGPVTYEDFLHEDEIPVMRDEFARLYESCLLYRKSLDRARLATDREYRDRAWERLVRAGTGAGFTKLTSRNGEKALDVDYTVSIIFDTETLGIGGCVVTTNDITSRRNMRERMEETERKNRDLFKLMPIFSMLVDTAGSAVDYNFQAAGAALPATAGAAGISYMDFIHPEDQRRAAALFMDLFSRAIEIKNRWIRDRRIDQEECGMRLGELCISGEPLRLIVRGTETVFESELSARLWLGEALEIKGALLSAIDVTERNDCRRKLEESERKYRELLEKKTRDIIFSLDGRARFVLVNGNIREKLGYAEEAVIGKNIVDILYRDPVDRNNLNRDTFLENINRVLRDGATDVRFNAVCDHHYTGDPLQLQFKLDPVILNGRVTGVTGFASETAEDPLIDFVREETLAYDIDNRITIADEVSFRVTRNLLRYLPDGKTSLVRLGVREMIVNAIEHGNLGITYEEKTACQKTQSYLDLIRERQRNEENRNKKAHITYRLDRNGAFYTVSDEGNGFNHEFYSGLDVRSLNERMIQHGRGILITRSVFDEVRYNDRGNEVYLAVYFRK